MPSYVFRCHACGPFESIRPMAAADRPAVCPACGAASARVFSGPSAGSMSDRRTLHRWVDRAGATAHEPAVVSAVPPARATPRTGRDPRQARLPRP